MFIFLLRIESICTTFSTRELHKVKMWTNIGWLLLVTTFTALCILFNSWPYRIHVVYMYVADNKLLTIQVYSMVLSSMYIVYFQIQTNNAVACKYIMYIQCKRWLAGIIWPEARFILFHAITKLSFLFFFYSIHSVFLFDWKNICTFVYINRWYNI